MTGADVRQYRRMIGKKQEALTKRTGLSRSVLPWRAGGTVVTSADRIAGLRNVFDKREFTSQLSRFLWELRQGREGSRVALSSSPTVWFHRMTSTMVARSQSEPPTY